jgi:hypothetical protein
MKRVQYATKSVVKVLARMYVRLNPARREHAGEIAHVLPQIIWLVVYEEHLNS